MRSRCLKTIILLLLMATGCVNSPESVSVSQDYRSDNAVVFLRGFCDAVERHDATKILL